MNLDLIDQPEVFSQWQISNDGDDYLYQQDDGFLLKDRGNAHLVYPLTFNYTDYDKLVVTFSTDQPIYVVVIPNISTTGFNTYELQKRVLPSPDFQTVEFSLRHHLFKDTLTDFGLNFFASRPANVVIKEIKLEKMSSAQVFVQAVKDYFLVAPYSPFTVNVIPTPRIFGHDAFIYLLPIFLVLAWLLFFSTKYRQAALVGLLILWLVTGLRLDYELFNYQKNDYQTWVKPPTPEKIFRNYGDLYVFIDWVKQNLPDDTLAINYYQIGSDYFPQIIQYYLYPTEVRLEASSAPVYVLFHQPNIKYNSEDNRLYRRQNPISNPGEIIATFNNNSFIFSEK